MSWVQYKGKEIFVIDYSNLTAEEGLKLLYETQVFFDSIQDPIYVLLNYTKFKYNKNFYNEGVRLGIESLHSTAFGEIYDWAGKWRTSDFKVGPHVPPSYSQVPTLMYQFLDELKFRLSQIDGESSLASVIAYAHHQIVKIHPFNNGNGRTSRLISDLIALKNGCDHIILYHREGEARKVYLEAIRKADAYDYSMLEELIKKQLQPLH